jgi:hypothetical protein
MKKHFMVPNRRDRKLPFVRGKLPPKRLAATIFDYPAENRTPLAPSTSAAKTIWQALQRQRADNFSKSARDSRAAGAKGYMATRQTDSESEWAELQA